MEIGEIFDGRYRIAGILGQGGMSRVYLAENIKLGTFWAIKELLRDADSGLELPRGTGLELPRGTGSGLELPRGTGSVPELPNETDMLKKLDHPALPRLYDIVENETGIYAIVDYIEGTSLDKKLAEDGRMPEKIVTGWAKELCSVLEYLHSIKPNPVIYRDMKPSNVIISKAGTIKLIDFGIAREYKAQSGNDTVFIGTRGYAPPEQYGTGQTDATSDIYSLGVMLHQLLTGKDPNKPPFELKPVRYYDSSLSAGIEGILQKCTRLKPAERYQSAPELLRDLESLEEYFDTNGAGERRYLNAAGSADTDDGSGWESPGLKCSRLKASKKLVLTIWDNPEFGCELAYAAAKLTDLSVMLVDLDLLAPKADLFLNIRKYSVLNPEIGVFGSSGLNSAMNSLEKNSISSNILPESAVKRKELKNLSVLTGNDRMENYEYYREDTLLKLIDQSSASYDLTVLLVNRSIYDSFSVIALARSDYNLVAVRADVDRLREFNNYIVFLNEKQKIPMEKTRFVAYEYDASTNLLPEEIIEATRGSLAGKVSYSRKRAAARNRSKPYAPAMEKEIIREYAKLLEDLDILQADGLTRRALERFRRAIVTRAASPEARS